MTAASSTDPVAMPRSSATPGHRILRRWETLRGVPAGKWLFSRFLGRMVPYTGTIRPQVEALEPGYARVRMADRRRVRNHLHSIHAIALANLAEVTSGLAFTVALPARARSILTGLSIEYLKKGRGRLVAECRCQAAEATERKEHSIETVIRDGTGDVVARATARWLVGLQE
jgi:acyl-coenzyme A thioesterase PaaI-like protein